MGPSQIYPNVCLSRLYEAGGHHDAASMESADQVSAHEDMNSAAAPRLPRRRPFSRTIPSGNHESRRSSAAVGLPTSGARGGV